MSKTFDRLKLFFLGVLVIACAAIWSYQIFYVWPKERCEAMGDWWDGHDRTCAVPMPIWTITGRRPGPAPRSAILSPVAKSR